jgi:phosphatidate phosphatase APP1
MPYHIVTFRGMVDDTGCRLSGRVLRRPLTGGPKQDDTWWDNLRSTWRRFDSEPQRGVSLDIAFAGHTGVARTDDEGYYTLELPGATVPEGALWHTAEVTRSEGGPVYLQPVLRVPDRCRIGIISDIDDTVLESKVTQWQAAAQLTFLHNARTRKPLAGVAALYQALQAGAGPKDAQNPVFYVSSSPWNLVDLLEDFLDLNAIPAGPLFLQDLGIGEGKFISPHGHRHKLDRVLELLALYPRLKWVLCGDSGQQDAELYAQAVLAHPDRIAAVYIRDVDPDTDSPYDARADERLAAAKATGVPMLRVRDSVALAEHAHSLGLIAQADIERVAREVERDRERPSQAQAAVAGAIEGDTGRVGKSSETPAQQRPAG